MVLRKLDFGRSIYIQKNISWERKIYAGNQTCVLVNAPRY